MINSGLPHQMTNTKFNAGAITAAVSLVVILMIWIIYTFSLSNDAKDRKTQQDFGSSKLQHWIKLVNHSRTTGIPISRADAYGFHAQTPLQRSFRSDKGVTKIPGAITTALGNNVSLWGSSRPFATVAVNPTLQLYSCNGCSASCWNPPSAQSTVPYLSQQSIKVANFVVGNIQTSPFTFYGMEATLTSDSNETSVQFQIAITNNPGTDSPINQITVGVAGAQGAGSIPLPTITEYTSLQKAINNYFPSMYVCPVYLGNASASDPNADKVREQFNKYQDLQKSATSTDNLINALKLYGSDVENNYSGESTTWTNPLLSTGMMYEYCCILFVGDIASIAAASGGGQLPQCTTTGNGSCNPYTGVAVLLIRDYDIESSIFCSHLQPSGSNACPNGSPAYMGYDDPKTYVDKGIYYMIAVANIVLSDQNNETLLDLDRWGFCNNYPTTGSVDGGSGKTITLISVETA